MAFGKAGSQRDAERLLRRLNFYDWEDDRILAYLARNQREFRRCLEWLSDGSIVNLEERFEEEEAESHELWQAWEEQPEVRFLQLHGFDHGGIELKPRWSDGNWFSGIEMDQRKSRDPLDLICWYLLSRLMVNGTVGVLRCKYEKCGKFFEPLTVRKLFCSDACRANDFMSKKTREAKAELMKQWRAKPEEQKKRRRRTKS
jgi:hypothetical protein